MLSCHVPLHPRTQRLSASRHIPREACPRLSKLEGGATDYLSRASIRKDPRDPFPLLARARVSRTHSIHLFHLYLQACEVFLASSLALGKASDACMPFVPVSMGSYYSAIYFPTFVFGSSFLPLLFLSPSPLYKVTFTRGGNNCARSQSILYYIIHHCLPTALNIDSTTTNHMPPSPRTAYFWRPSSARKST
jgi:hypothetical protein